MSGAAWSWGLSAVAHVAFVAAAFVWPVTPELGPEWDEAALRLAVIERPEIVVAYVPPEPEPEPAVEAASVDAGGAVGAAEVREVAPAPVKRPKVREAAPVVVERTEEAAAPIAAPVESASLEPAEPVAVAVVTPAEPVVPVGRERGDGVGGGGAQGEPVGIGGGVDRAGLLKAYRRSIYTAVDSRKQYPALARRARLSGVVHVAVVVDGGGQILEVRVERSSGHELLDEAACEAVRGLGKMPSPPEGLVWTRQKIVIPVKYVS